MSALDTYPREVALAWVYCEMLRRLGFDPGDIKVGAVRGTAFGAVATVVRVELTAQDREFGIHAAVWSHDPERFNASWEEFVSRLNDGRLTDEDLGALWDRHNAEADSEELVARLLAKGIVPPAFGACAS